MVGFEGSDTPLEEDILKKRIDFFATQGEWNNRNSREIFTRLGIIGASTGTVYTAPSNINAFISSMNVDATTTTAVLNNIAQFRRVNAAGAILQIVIFRMPIIQQEHAEMTFNPPMMLRPGDRIEITAGTTMVAGCWIHGWEEAKRIN